MGNGKGKDEAHDAEEELFSSVPRKLQEALFTNPSISVTHIGGSTRSAGSPAPEAEARVEIEERTMPLLQAPDLGALQRAREEAETTPVPAVPRAARKLPPEEAPAPPGPGISFSHLPPPVEPPPPLRPRKDTARKPAAPTPEAAPAWRIGALDARGQVAREVVVTGRRFLIGRERSDLALDDPFVSPWHAQLSINAAGELELEELTSLNGVFLRIADDFPLEDGDELVLGQQRFVFHTTSAPPAWRSSAHAEVRVQGGATPGRFVHLIHLLDGGHIGGLYPVRGELSIGREGCTVCCPEDSALHTRHALISPREDGGFVLRDLRSPHGTFIRVGAPVELIPGDVFLIGQTRLVVMR